jgi:hypothetical protein
VVDSQHDNRPVPPLPPCTAAGLMSEFYGVFDSCFPLYQGMVHYWLMWRLPQIVNAIQSAPGLKFHLCAPYDGLLDNFHRVFLLPDLLIIGQCGHVLKYEMLQFEHSINTPWPNTDGTQPSLGVIGMKPDRPLVDGVLQFLYEWVRPLHSSGQVLFAPFTSMLAEPGSNPFSVETVNSLLKSAIVNTSVAGLPGQNLGDALERAGVQLKSQPEGTTIPFDSLVEKKPQHAKGALAFDPAKMELKYGRYFWPGSSISEIDTSWGPAEILAFEFMMANQLGSMLVVAGNWCEAVPAPGYALNLRIPYIEARSIPVIAQVMQDDPGSYEEFRRTMSTALIEAMDKRGSEGFAKELQKIQRDIIDIGIAKLDRKLRELQKGRRLRLAQYAVKSISVSVGLYFTPFSVAAIAGLFGTAVPSLLGEIEKRMAEKGVLRENPMYFIWRLGQ